MDDVIVLCVRAEMKANYRNVLRPKDARLHQGQAYSTQLREGGREGWREGRKIVWIRKTVKKKGPSQQMPAQYCPR